MLVTDSDFENGTIEVAHEAIFKAWPYLAFYQAKDGYHNKQWWENLEREGQWEQYRQIANCPVDTVNWYDAIAFGRWLSKKLGYEVRLPTEWE